MSLYAVTITRAGAGLDRTIQIEAPHAAAARVLAERQCEAGESVPAGERYCVLEAYAHVDPSPVMPPDHARNVALGLASREQQKT